MKLSNHQDVIRLISNDLDMMQILETVKSINLPDWWIWAGFIRNKVWDYLHWYREKTIIWSSDIDVVYFDSKNINEDYEKIIENKLGILLPWKNWSAKNQARMHTINQQNPYKDSLDAISNWPETVTCIAIKLDQDNNIIFKTLWWIEDLINLEVRPSPFFKSCPEMLEKYNKRIKEKNWIKYWPKLKFYDK